MSDRGSRISLSQRALAKYHAQKLQEECLASARLLDEFRSEKMDFPDDKLTMASIQEKIAASITKKTLLRQLNQELDGMFSASQDH